MCKELEEKLAYHSAPALCGIKPSNLINISNNSLHKVLSDIKSLNEIYNPNNCFQILKKTDSGILLLVYKKKKLEEYLFLDDNRSYLESIGYKRSDYIDDYIYELKRRINDNEIFPHEIGLFLGYDLDDTLEFIKGNKKPLLKGVWNVYSKKEEKRILFEKYYRCRDCVVRLVNKGFSIENFMK